jgi:hypothetical protein
MKPILFTDEMVRAIIDARKFQTRRVINKLLGFGKITDFGPSDTPGYDWQFRDRRMLWNEITTDQLMAACPYGQVGGKLWVREAWRVGAWNADDQQICVDYRADGYARRDWLDVPDVEMFERLWIQSTDDAIKAGLEPDDGGWYWWESGEGPTRWRPNIFMPKFARRITLPLTGMRVERVQDIRERDAIVEGVAPNWCGPLDGWLPKLHGYHNYLLSEDIADLEGQPENLTATESFVTLWESINADRGYGWDANPWVWVPEWKEAEVIA